MADSIRELCLKNLKAALELITIANGYSLTVALVERSMPSGQTTTDTPYILIIEGEETATEAEHPMITKWLDVFLDCQLRLDESTDTRSADEAINAFQSDIEKALEIDFSRGGYAIDTIEQGATASYVIEGQSVIGRGLQYRIHYRHQRGMPDTL